jgi:hypothetical protein
MFIIARIGELVDFCLFRIKLILVWAATLQELQMSYLLLPIFPLKTCSADISIASFLGVFALLGWLLS